MNNSRILGNNISLELQKSSIELLDFASQIGYSEQDVHKLIEGRLFVPPFQLGKIAESLKVTKEELLVDRGMDSYNYLIHNFRNFKNADNQELVLDLIDMYADLEEALAEE